MRMVKVATLADLFEHGAGQRIPQALPMMRAVANELLEQAARQQPHTPPGQLAYDPQVATRIIDSLARAEGEVARTRAAEAAAAAAAPKGENAKNFFTRLAIATGVGSGLAMGAAGAGAGFDALRRKATESGNFRKMLDYYPELKKDEGRAKDAFKVMHRYAPDITGSPQVAGAFTKRVMEMPGAGISHQTVKELLDTQNALHASREGKGTFFGSLKGLSQVTPRYVNPKDLDLFG